MRRILAAVIAVGICGCSGASHPSTTSTPDAADKALSAGLAAQRHGDLDTASRLYSEVIAKRPTDVYAHYNLGVIAQQQGHRATALRDYAAALTANPDYLPALFNEATLYQATDPIQAITLYQQILRIQPISPTAQLNLGLLEARQGDTRQANHDLSAAVREDPSLAEQGGQAPTATSSPAAGP